MDTEGPGSSTVISISTRAEGLFGNRTQKLRWWAVSHFSCACVDSLLSKDFSACEEQTLVFIKLTDEHKNDLLSEKRKLFFRSGCFYFLPWRLCEQDVHWTNSNSSCVCSWHVNPLKGNVSCAGKGDWILAKINNLGGLGFLTSRCEISALKWGGTEKERWWKYTFLRTKTTDMERNWMIGSF